MFCSSITAHMPSAKSSIEFKIKKIAENFNALSQIIKPRVMQICMQITS